MIIIITIINIIFGYLTNLTIKKINKFTNKKTLGKLSFIFFLLPLWITILNLIFYIIDIFKGQTDAWNGMGASLLFILPILQIGMLFFLLFIQLLIKTGQSIKQKF